MLGFQYSLTYKKGWKGNMKKIISGMFLQEVLLPAIGYDTGIGEVVVIQPKQLQQMFTGVIFPREEIHLYDGVNGYIFDAYGVAFVYSFEENETSLSFTKQYMNRQDSIDYHFNKKEGNEWIGTFNGKATGAGYSSCVINVVSDKFLDSSRFADIPLPPTSVNYVNIT